MALYQVLDEDLSHRYSIALAYSSAILLQGLEPIPHQPGQVGEHMSARRAFVTTLHVVFENVHPC